MMLVLVLVLLLLLLLLSASPTHETKPGPLSVSMGATSTAIAGASAAAVAAAGGVAALTVAYAVLVPSSTIESWYTPPQGTTAALETSLSLRLLASFLRWPGLSNESMRATVYVGVQLWWWVTVRSEKKNGKEIAPC